MWERLGSARNVWRASVSGFVLVAATTLVGHPASGGTDFGGFVAVASAQAVRVSVETEGYLIVRKDDGTDTLILAGGVRAART